MGTDVEGWLDEFEQVFSANNVLDERKVSIISHYLVGSVSVWHEYFLSVMGENVDWISYKKAILRRFGNSRDDSSRKVSGSKRVVDSSLPSRLVENILVEVEQGFDDVSMLESDKEWVDGDNGLCGSVEYFDVNKSIEVRSVLVEEVVVETVESFEVENILVVEQDVVKERSTTILSTKDSKENDDIKCLLISNDIVKGVNVSKEGHGWFENQKGEISDKSKMDSGYVMRTNKELLGVVWKPMVKMRMNGSILGRNYLVNGMTRDSEVATDESNISGDTLVGLVSLYQPSDDICSVKRNELEDLFVVQLEVIRNVEYRQSHTRVREAPDYINVQEYVYMVEAPVEFVLEANQVFDPGGIQVFYVRASDYINVFNKHEMDTKVKLQLAIVVKTCIVVELMLISDKCNEPFTSVRRSCACCYSQWSHIGYAGVGWNMDRRPMKNGVDCIVMESVMVASQLNHSDSCQRMMEEEEPEMDIEVPELVNNELVPEVVYKLVGTKTDIEERFGSESHPEVGMELAVDKSISRNSSISLVKDTSKQGAKGIRPGLGYVSTDKGFRISMFVETRVGNLSVRWLLGSYASEHNGFSGVGYIEKDANLLNTCYDSRYVEGQEDGSQGCKVATCDNIIFKGNGLSWVILGVNKVKLGSQTSHLVIHFPCINTQTNCSFQLAMKL